MNRDIEERYARCQEELSTIVTLAPNVEKKFPDITKERDVDGAYQLGFPDHQAKRAFRRQLLKRTKPEYNEEQCLAAFSPPDWQLRDWQKIAAFGGDFSALPTVVYYEGGVVLYVTEPQVMALKENPWVCSFTLDGQDWYFRADDADYLAIVP